MASEAWPSSRGVIGTFQASTNGEAATGAPIFTVGVAEPLDGRAALAKTERAFLAPRRFPCERCVISP